MPRYEIKLAPPPENPDGGQTWIENGSRELEVGDELLADGRWIRLMREAVPVVAEVDHAYVAATAPPVGGLTCGDTTLEIYREDAKALLTELAANADAPGADEAMTRLERLIREEDADDVLSDDAFKAIATAAEGAVQKGTASAPLIQLRAAIQQAIKK